MEENNSTLLGIQRELKKTETDLRKSQKEVQEIESSITLLKKRKDNALRKKAESELRWRIKTEGQAKTKENMRVARSRLRAIQNELQTVRKDLHLAEGGEEVGNFEEFLERQVKELETDLCCPVCFNISKAAPIYKCTDDHLVCK